MIKFLTVTLCILLTTLMISTAWAQSSTSGRSGPLYDMNAAKNIASNIMPVLPDETFTAAPGNTIPPETMEKIYDTCTSKMPRHFTPESLRYYCACSAAATSANISMSELIEMQDRRNWKLGNKTFEKYVHEVMAQCIDVPVDDKEYMACVTNRSTDWRVERVPLYCKCVSKGMKNYASKFGEIDMMMEWGNTSKWYLSPLEALYYNNNYVSKKNEYAKNCIGHYRSKDPLGRY